MLCVASAALVAFILGLGDFRRQRFALAQLRWQANNYERRIGADGVMPLNFEPEIPPVGTRKMIRLEWLDRSSAAKLRDGKGPVIVAQTVPILQVFGYDGRAVMTFKGGKLNVEWMRLPRFNVLWTAQQKTTGPRTSESPVDAPIIP